LPILNTDFHFETLPVEAAADGRGVAEWEWVSEVEVDVEAVSGYGEVKDDIGAGVVSRYELELCISDAKSRVGLVFRCSYGEWSRSFTCYARAARAAIRGMCKVTSG
jgi:hypothetical protein